MSVELECKECRNTFTVSKYRAGVAMFCSNDCSSKNRSKGSSNPPVNAECKGCGELFRSRFKKSTGKYVLYCNIECFRSSRRVELKCAGCGCAFKRYKHEVESKKPKNIFCSNDCRCNTMNGDKCGGYNGGKYINDHGFVVINNNGYFVLEHRMLVERYIGRKLDYCEEPILHINGLKHDNRLSNLYVCKDRSDMGFIIHSYDVPYPVKSNVEQLKLDVIDGKRKPTD